MKADKSSALEARVAELERIVEMLPIVKGIRTEEARQQAQRDRALQAAAFRTDPTARAKILAEATVDQLREMMAGLQLPQVVEFARELEGEALERLLRARDADHASRDGGAARVLFEMEPGFPALVELSAPPRGSVTIGDRYQITEELVLDFGGGGGQILPTETLEDYLSAGTPGSRALAGRIADGIILIRPLEPAEAKAWAWNQRRR